MIVDEVGLDALADPGMTVEAARQDPTVVDVEALEFDSETAARALDGLGECIDIAVAASGAMSAGLGISEASAECVVRGVLGEPVARAALADNMFGVGEGTNLFDPSDAGMAARMFGILTECLTAEEVARLMGGRRAISPDRLREGGWLDPRGTTR